jgi:hypothetical protein
MTTQIGPYTQTEEAKRQYDARLKRVFDCVALKKPDRMPFGIFNMFWFAKYGGMSCREQMYDLPRLKQVIEQATLDLQPDMYTPALMASGFGNPIDVMGYRQLQWPGHGVEDHRPFQYIDREYMTPEEYDDFLFDPTGFYLGKYLPRVADAYAGLEPIATLTGSFYIGTCLGAAAFADPRIAAAVDRLGKASGVMLEQFDHIADLDMRMRSLGFPAAFGNIAMAPYDIIADYFRGATGMMKDMFRHGEKMLQVLDKMAVYVIRAVLATAQQTDNPIVFIPIHWAPDAFMSQKQFEKFWWPSYKTVIDALIGANLIPMTMWEHDCAKRLPFLREHTPRAKCIHWFERTDMLKASAALADVVALRGGLPGSLMISGTPAEVDAEVRRLVENVYDKGGRLILEGAFGLPDEAPVENVRAMCAAARRYGGG